MNRVPTVNQERKFTTLKKTSPQWWALSADRLHAQAISLFHLGDEGLWVRQLSDGSILTTGEHLQGCFLLASAALECAIKAFVLVEHPEFLSDPGSASLFASQEFLALSKKSSHIRNTKRDQAALAAFEFGARTWMREPSSADMSDARLSLKRRLKLWEDYKRIMRGYGVDLVKLLGDGWTEAAGKGERFEMRAEFLSAA